MTPFLVAIQPDDDGPLNSSSPIWIDELTKVGVETRVVNVYADDILRQLRDCHGFMYRCSHFSDARQIGRRLLPVLENELGMVVYPNVQTFWHYDDKIAQALLFEARAIPAPRTWTFFGEAEARKWITSANCFPLVFKLAGGAGSTNVQLVHNARQALDLVELMFSHGVRTMDEASPLATRLLPGTRKQMRHLGHRFLPASLGGKLSIPRRARDLLAPPDSRFFEVHKNYILFQEFLPNNAYDTRVTVVGDRAFGFRRFNRPGDFRASGSGSIDADPTKIDLGFVKLAFRVARELRLQSVAIDGLYRGSEHVVGEISYAYVSGAVHNCPGQWDEQLRWHEGNVWPEQQQVLGVLRALEERFPQGATGGSSAQPAGH